MSVENRLDYGLSIGSRDTLHLEDICEIIPYNPGESKLFGSRLHLSFAADPSTMVIFLKPSTSSFASEG